MNLEANLDEMIQEYLFVNDAIEALKLIPAHYENGVPSLIQERILKLTRIRLYEREAIYRCIYDVVELLPLSRFPYIPDEFKN